MKLLWILAGIAAALIGLTLLFTYICFRMAFYISERAKRASDGVIVPPGEVYAPFRERMETWAQETRVAPHEEVEITSFDGLKLRGKYYEYAPGAPIELMFHGYRGTAERDLSGGKQRCFKLGHSAFIVNQRASIGSEGNVISFGVNESRDCLAWVDFMVEHFGPEVKIILCGISMGAATVLIASGRPLPPNVIGVLADCGYNSQKDIIQTVIRQLKLPVAVVYPFIKLAARLYGKFDLEACSPMGAVKKCTVPVIFFHGEEDDFVPCEMSRVNYEACTARKRLVTVPGAGHGLSYPVAPEAYLDALREFFGNGEEARE